MAHFDLDSQKMASLTQGGGMDRNSHLLHDLSFLIIQRVHLILTRVYLKV